jgi:hypothetical protein
MTCDNCGNQSARHIKISYRDKEKGSKEVVKEEHCEACANLKNAPDYPRDAAGNRVVVPADQMGKFSYATDGPITSARQLSEHCKRNDLAQRG